MILVKSFITVPIVYIFANYFHHGSAHQQEPGENGSNRVDWALYKPSLYVASSNWYVACVQNAWHTPGCCVKWEYSYTCNEFRTTNRYFHTEFVVHVLAHMRDFILGLEFNLN